MTNDACGFAFLVMNSPLYKTHACRFVGWRKSCGRGRYSRAITICIFTCRRSHDDRSRRIRNTGITVEVEGFSPPNDFSPDGRASAPAALNRKNCGFASSGNRCGRKSKRDCSRWCKPHRTSDCIDAINMRSLCFDLNPRHNCAISSC